MTDPKDSAPRLSPRLGLCCIFRDVPIKFRTTTAAAMLRLDRTSRLARLAELALANARALRGALAWCATNGVGAFRMLSQILPVKTHPQCGYQIDQLPDGAKIEAEFRLAGEMARRLDVRLSFHPDQFVVLNSPRADVVARSIEELEYQAEVADWIGADVLNVHAGGAYGDKARALDALRRTLDTLPHPVRSRLSLENDDVTYTPADLLPLCRTEGVPFCYDAHHHRCLADALTVDEATAAAMETWRREPLFHISSPLGGWTGPDPKRHDDFIDPADFPSLWRTLPITVDVKAKAKEAAVLRLAAALQAAAPGG